MRRVGIALLLKVYTLCSSFISFCLLYHLTKNLLSPQAPTEKLNVLFIVVDDLKPALGIYGDPLAVTPNLDQLGSRSHVFQHSYAQLAYCMPSRASFLTSRRPDSTQVVEDEYWRNRGGNFTTLPEYFKLNGYLSLGVGKIHHYYHRKPDQSPYDEPYSWSGKFQDPNCNGWPNIPCLGGQNLSSREQLNCPVDMRRSPCGKLVDTLVTESAIQLLKQEATHGGQPFFLAVGFRKPHMPFEFPVEYLRLHPREKISPWTRHKAHPSIPDIALYASSCNLLPYKDMAKYRLGFDVQYALPREAQILMRQMYYSAVTYIDHQIGILLEQLPALGLAQNTIVSVISDHGFALGENGQYTKFTNFEAATKVPWILHDPRHSRGSDFKAINPLKRRRRAHRVPLRAHMEPVELVDVFPTLVDLSGLPSIPNCPQSLGPGMKTCTEGTSRAEIVAEDLRPAESFAISQFARKFKQGDNKTMFMGYTVRSRWLRYTEWLPMTLKNYTIHWNQGVVDRELYQYRDDQTLIEEKNLALEPNFQQDMEQLSRIVRKYSQRQMPRHTKY